MNKKVKKLKLGMVMLGAGFLASVMVLPIAKGELIYDNERPEASQDDSVARALEATQGNQSAGLSSGQTSGNVAPIIIQQQPTVTSRVASTSSSQIEENQNSGRAELLRRQRMREEMKNEDVLQERLETLRLKDEEKRTDLILGNNATVATTNANGNIQIQSQTVTAPATELAETSAKPKKEISTDEGSTGVGVSLIPHFGMSSMSGNEMYEIQSRYSAGIGLGVRVADNMEFEAVYSYSEYGMKGISSNPIIRDAQGYSTGNLNPDFESRAYKQNLVDAGLKLLVLNADSKIRPYVGGGGGYSKSYLNYDSRMVDFLNQNRFNNLASDYEVSSLVGYLSTGLDVRVSKSVSVGAAFKYYKVLSAKENHVNAMAMPGYGSGYRGYQNCLANQQDYEKAMEGGSLARNSFYTITAGVNFIF